MALDGPTCVSDVSRVHGTERGSPVGGVWAPESAGPQFNFRSWLFVIFVKLYDFPVFSVLSAKERQ